MEPLLQAEHITICYHGTPVVCDVSFEIQKGEILGIVGDSGSGKSSIIKAVTGLLGNSGMVTRGDVYYKGLNVVDMPKGELRKLLVRRSELFFRTANQLSARYVRWGIRSLKA